MQRFLMLILLAVLLSIGLLACQAEEDAPPATSAPRIPPTAPPSATTAGPETAGDSAALAQGEVTPTEGPSATPFVISTLPPERDLRPPTFTPPPTRTPPPSITPRPSATSNLLVDVTPVELLVQPTAPRGPTLEISYDTLALRAQSFPIPDTNDRIVPNSQTITWDDDQPIYQYDVVPLNAAEAINVTATMDFSFDATIGRVFVLFVSIYNTDNPAVPYSGESALILEDQLQDALDAAIVEAVRDSGEQNIFAVTRFDATPDGMTFDIILR